MNEPWTTSDVSEESRIFLDKSLTSPLPDNKEQRIKSSASSIEMPREAFRQLDKNNLDKIVEWMKCANCMKIVIPSNLGEIQICLKGHVLCPDHQLPACPYGKMGNECLSRLKSRPVDFYMKLCQIPMFSCSTKTFNGCPKMLTALQLESHVKSCKFNPIYSCHYNNCTYPKVNLTYLIRHMEDEHATILTDGMSEVEIPMPFVPGQSHPWEKFETFIPAIIEWDDFPMALSMVRWNDSIYFKVRLLHPEPHPDGFKVEWHVQGMTEWTKEVPSPFPFYDYEEKGPKDGVPIKIDTFLENCVQKGKCEGAKDFFVFEMYEA